jgi:DNA-binding transcriptional regulator YdaS (Cro superfamily)
MAASEPSGVEGELPSESTQMLRWTDEQNARRCTLIEKDVRGTIAPEEARELEDLQDQLRRYRRHGAPLPLAQTRQMLEELERKAQAIP